MLRAALVFTVLMSGGTATAQTTPSREDVARVGTCVQTAAASGSQAQVLAQCSDIIAGACRGQTTLEIADCVMREAGAWDSWLNAWWGPMRARAQANGSWDRLLAAQRQWIKDRDAECARAYDRANGGSIRVIYGADCQRDLTARKAIEFYFSLYR
ncbi:lysozyme inhibitor LprI family protein [uncultured Limimaricola sp.]|uniref:lysozyme inhibitor LprI family protein n=1 Tax=uncultured Limimaricola sp. TaxID=2211667 RepID=UPI0030F80636